MASSAFSFHCMICFEEFDTQTNYPVVLPCGHTYVCVECANRLDKCMECRMPLTMKLELPAPPPSRHGGGGGGGGEGPGGGASSSAPSAPVLDHQKENQKNLYADRVRNSPGFRRRYGHLEEYSDGGHGKRGGPQGSSPRTGNPQQPPVPAPKIRLPLPKNAVLLSLIQASEPARRRAEVEAPSTPQKSDHRDLASPPRLPSSSSGGGGTTASKTLQYNRPSPLFHLDGSSSGEHHDVGSDRPHAPAHHLLGSPSSVDDEEHKIRVGTYLEGGPCGTYAVAARGGLLVYPTLFEHTLPRSLDGHEADAVTRDVEKVVKNYYKESAAGNMMKTKGGGGGGDDAAADAGGRGAKDWGAGGDPVAPSRGKSSSARPPFDRSSGTPPRPAPGSRRREAASGVCPSPLSTTLVENHEDENVEAHCCEMSIDASSHLAGVGIDLTQLEDDGQDEYSVSDVGGENEAEAEAEVGVGVGEGPTGGGTADPGPIGIGPGPSSLRPRSHPRVEPPSPGGAAAGGASSPVGPDDEVDDFDVGVGLSMSYQSIDVSDSSNEDDLDDDEGGDSLSDIGVGSAQVLRPRLKPQGMYSRSTSDVGACASSSLSGETKLMKNFERQFSQGASLSIKKKTTTSGDSNNDDFERPLIRLKYGDRVQVVSMDSRGWVKLARGYGYIRLESDKQLVKVGGTSDKACQIEAMLHELSIERNRLKHEQMKLERLSAGLMIDLQSSLLTSDDNVVVSAPVGMIRSDSELSMTHRRCDSDLHIGSSKVPGAAATSLDDIVLNARSPDATPAKQQLQREIRTAKSHSPGRSPSLGTLVTPPSPPYGQIMGNPNLNTPTRVNFRTGLSGHRALTSSHSHPHDFIGGGTIRSMSNHAGISSTVKKTDRRGRSIY